METDVNGSGAESEMSVIEFWLGTLWLVLQNSTTCDWFGHWVIQAAPIGLVCATQWIHLMETVRTVVEWRLTDM